MLGQEIRRQVAVPTATRRIGRSKMIEEATTTKPAGSLSSLSLSIVQAKLGLRNDPATIANQVGGAEDFLEDSGPSRCDDRSHLDNGDLEPPKSVRGCSKDRLLFSVFHLPMEDTTTVRSMARNHNAPPTHQATGGSSHTTRRASPSFDAEDFNLATSPLTSSSAVVLEREYDRDTWRLYNRIHSSRNNQGNHHDDDDSGVAISSVPAIHLMSSSRLREHNLSALHAVSEGSLYPPSPPPTARALARTGANNDDSALFDFSVQDDDTGGHDDDADNIIFDLEL